VFGQNRNIALYFPLCSILSLYRVFNVYGSFAMQVYLNVLNFNSFATGLKYNLVVWLSGEYIILYNNDKYLLYL